jgi:hypothetical protein
MRNLVLVGSGDCAPGIVPGIPPGGTPSDPCPPGQGRQLPYLPPQGMRGPWAKGPRYPEIPCLNQAYEVTTHGFDDNQQGLSSDPLGTMPTQTAGIRLPPYLTVNNRYLVLLASRKIHKPTRLVGLAQFITLGASFQYSSGEAPQATIVYETPQTTPTWRFPDGNVSWHLVYEDGVDNSTPHKATTDTVSFVKRKSDSPALLYETFTAAPVDPITGAPISYPTGITAYTPPNIWGGWKPVAANLWNFSDLRFPNQAAQRWYSLGPGVCVPITDGTRRISLYASVLQPSGTFQGTGLSSAPLGFAPEDQFIFNVEQISGSPIVQYWRVGGSLIFEDEY